MPETGAEHDLASPDCWCDPDVHLICPVCDPEPAGGPHPSRQGAIRAMADGADPNCWKCGGEGLVGDPEPWEAQESAVLVAHRYDA